MSAPPRRGLLTALLLLLVAAVHSGSLLSGFHLDDRSTIVENPSIRSPGNIPRLFSDAQTLTTIPGNAVYRPLYPLTLAADYWLAGGLDPRVFHATQILLFLLLTWGVGALAGELFTLAGLAAAATGYAALAAALLFGLHPVNSEIVNYLSARSELLSALCTVWALFLFLRLRRSRGVWTWIPVMALGALAKTVALMTPALAALAPALFPRCRREPGARAAGRTLIAGFLLAPLIFFFLQRMNGPQLHWGSFTRPDYLRTQGWAVAHYLQLWVAPFNLCADYPQIPIHGWLDGRLVAATLVHCGLLLTVVLAWRSGAELLRVYAWGILAFYLALLPSSSLIPLSELVREYRVTLPAAGLAIASVALLATWVARKPRAAPWASSLVLLAAGLFAWQTRVRSAVWRDDLSLWRSVVTAQPRNMRGWIGLAQAHTERGEWDAALQALQIPLAAGLDDATIHLTRAAPLANLGRMEEAGREITAALRSEPDSPAALFAAAQLSRLNHDNAAARAALKHLLAIAPDRLDARQLLLGIARDEGDWPEFCGQIRYLMPPDEPSRALAAAHCAIP